MESVARSRSHGVGRMESVTWSRSHGVGHMESVTWSRSHGVGHTESVAWIHQMQCFTCIRIRAFREGLQGEEGGNLLPEGEG